MRVETVAILSIYFQGMAKNVIKSDAVFKKVVGKERKRKLILSLSRLHQHQQKSSYLLTICTTTKNIIFFITATHYYKIVFTYHLSQQSSWAKLTMKWLLVSVFVIDMVVTYSYKFMLDKIRIPYIKSICCAFLSTCFWLDLSFSFIMDIKGEKRAGHHIK